jgi:hypothetical protein
MSIGNITINICMKINEVLSPKVQKFKQKAGQLSPVGSSTTAPIDKAKERVEDLVKITK